MPRKSSSNKKKDSTKASQIPEVAPDAEIEQNPEAPKPRTRYAEVLAKLRQEGKLPEKRSGGTGLVKMATKSRKRAASPTEAPELDPETLENINSNLEASVRLYGTKPILELEEAGRIMHFETRNDEKLCQTVPEGCPPNTHIATFLIDVSKIAPMDLCRDKYGYWGRSFSHKGYFRVDDEEASKIVKVTRRDQHDFIVERLKWVHQDASNDFSKSIYRYIDSHGNNLWALVYYQWFCEPFEFEPSQLLVVPAEKFQLNPDSVVVEDFNKQFEDDNIRLFSFTPITSLSDAADILVFQSGDPNRVSTAVPEFCPAGTRSATFLVDISQLGDTRDVNRDCYGVWGSSSGHKGHFRLFTDAEKGQRLVKVDKEGDYDFVIQRLKYMHKDTDNKFIKLLYKCVDRQGQQLFALICYEWLCEPFDFEVTNAQPAGYRRWTKGQSQAKDQTHEEMSIQYEDDDDQVQLFCVQPIQSLLEAAEILIFQANDEAVHDRISTTVPQLCPRGTRTATYLVDTTKLGPGADVIQDGYGVWGASHGSKAFYRVFMPPSSKQTLHKVYKEDPYDFQIHRVRSSHRDTGNRLCKVIYRCTDAQDNSLFALISYEWHCEPFDFIPTSLLPADQRERDAVKLRDGKVYSATSVFVPEDPALLQELNEQLPEGVVVFSTRPVTLMSDAAIMSQFQTDDHAQRICIARPPFMPQGVRSCTFLVDLRDIPHSRDLTCDRYGIWGNSSGLKSHFSVDYGNKSVKRVDPAIEPWDVMVARLRYKHPDTDKKFYRTIYWMTDLHGREQFSIVCYEWKCEPFEFIPSCHGNSTKTNEPYIRTAPSVLESVREAVTHFKPMDAYDAVMKDTACEVTEHTDVPRDMRQVRNMSFRTPGAWSRKRARISSDKKRGPLDPPSSTITQKKWKDLIRMSKEVAETGQIADFPGQEDLYLVIVNRASHTVQRINDAEYICDCSDFALYKHICPHTMATAKLDNVSKQFLDLVRNKFDNGFSDSSGSGVLNVSKGKAKLTPRKVPVLETPKQALFAFTGTPMARGPVTMLVPNEEEVKDLQIKKPPTYTQPFHNDRPFILAFLEDYVSEEERRECAHCQVEFPPLNIAMAPEDIVIAHEERVFNEVTGKYAMERKLQLIHARYVCMVNRYPYFYTGLLQVDEAAVDKMSPDHRTHFEEQFGINLEFETSN